MRACARQPRHDRPLLDVEELCDLRVGEPSPEAEFDDLSMMHAEPCDQLAPDASHLLVVDPSLDIFPFGNEHVSVDFQNLSASLAISDVVEAGVGRDPVEPGLDLEALGEQALLPIRLDEDLLHDLLCRFSVLGDAERMPEHRFLVPTVETLMCQSLVSTCDQLQVRVLSREVVVSFAFPFLSASASHVVPRGLPPGLAVTSL